MAGVSSSDLGDKEHSVHSGGSSRKKGVKRRDTVSSTASKGKKARLERKPPSSSPSISQTAPVPAPKLRKRAPGSDAGEVAVRGEQEPGHLSAPADDGFRVTEFYYPMADDGGFPEGPCSLSPRSLRQLFFQDRAAAIKASDVKTNVPSADGERNQPGKLG